MNDETLLAFTCPYVFCKSHYTFDLLHFRSRYGVLHLIAFYWCKFFSIPSASSILRMIISSFILYTCFPTIADISLSFIMWTDKLKKLIYDQYYRENLTGKLGILIEMQWLTGNVLLQLMLNVFQVGEADQVTEHIS